MYSQDAPDCNSATDWHGVEEWRYARLRARAFVTKTYATYTHAQSPCAPTHLAPVWQHGWCKAFNSQHVGQHQAARGRMRVHAFAFVTL